MAPLFAHVITVQPQNPRSLPAEDLAEKAGHYCSDCKAAESVEEALSMARTLCGEDGVMVVCGSFYLASEVRPFLLSGEKKESAALKIFHILQGKPRMMKVIRGFLFVFLKSQA